MARENILVVDDEPDMRDALTVALRREGLCISTAANGVEALEKVQGQSFDLIITDVRMPRMGGLALLQELKRTSPTIPVIMMTGYGRIEDAVEAMKAGAFDYLLKPFSLEDLKAVVAKALTPPHTLTKPLVEPARQEEQDSFESGGNIERPIVTDDSRMLQVIELAKEAASSKATVLIQGESGTGKEVLHAIFTPTARGMCSHLWQSIVPPSLKDCSRASFRP